MALILGDDNNDYKNQIVGVIVLLAIIIITFIAIKKIRK